MRSVLQRLYHGSPLGRRLLTPAKQLEDLVCYRLLPAPLLLRLSFKRFLGYDLDLAHPRTLNEKIQWLKLFARDPIQTHLADKASVREYVQERVGEGHLVPLVGVWDHPDDIDFDRLPDSFVLKATHGCGWNVLCPDRTSFDVSAARERLKTWHS